MVIAAWGYVSFGEAGSGSVTAMVTCPLGSQRSYQSMHMQSHNSEPGVTGTKLYMHMPATTYAETMLYLEPGLTEHTYAEHTTARELAAAMGIAGDSNNM